MDKNRYTRTGSRVGRRTATGKKRHLAGIETSTRKRTGNKAGTGPGKTPGARPQIVHEGEQVQGKELRIRQGHVQGKRQEHGHGQGQEGEQVQGKELGIRPEHVQGKRLGHCRRQVQEGEQVQGKKLGIRQGHVQGKTAGVWTQTGTGTRKAIIQGQE